MSATTNKSNPLSAIQALRAHWPEYALEAIELGLFMISACVFTIILFHPSSPSANVIESPLLKRVVMGIAMGLTGIALIYSPMGQRSGAHMNPATTLTFWRLGKIETWDAVFYVIAQFIGGAGGVMLISLVLGESLRHESVHFAATTPASTSIAGITIAWIAEFVIAFIMMTVVLNVSNRKSVARFTGVFAGMLVATYIVVESPFSGMSLNPARTFASALSAHIWNSFWIYVTAPPLAMLAASEAYLRLNSSAQVYCAKLNHFNDKRCIFRCRIGEMMEKGSALNPSHENARLAPSHMFENLRMSAATSLSVNTEAPAARLSSRSIPSSNHSTPSHESLYFG